MNAETKNKIKAILSFLAAIGGWFLVAAGYGVDGPCFKYYILFTGNCPFYRRNSNVLSICYETLARLFQHVKDFINAFVTG
jgi:hypothetical protein